MVKDFLASMAARDAAQRMKAVKELEMSFERFSRDMGKRDWRREYLYER